jgi:hypothetical protein
MVTLNISEFSYPPTSMANIANIVIVLIGSTLSITGFSVVSSVEAQMTGDNATMSGNMTGGNATGGNTTGSISSTDFVNDADDPE